MSNFFDRLPLQSADELEQLSRLQYELRESHKALLRPYDVANEALLLEKIAAGELSEHPAYEHYLGARTIALAQEEVRSQLTHLLKVLGG